MAKITLFVQLIHSLLENLFKSFEKKRHGVGAVHDHVVGSQTLCTYKRDSRVALIAMIHNQQRIHSPQFL
jgi:hypothetical protein